LKESKAISITFTKYYKGNRLIHFFAGKKLCKKSIILNCVKNCLMVGFEEKEI